MAALRNGEHHEDLIFFSLQSALLLCLLLLSPHCPLILHFFFSFLGEDNPLVAAEFIFPLFPQSKTSSSHFQSHVGLRRWGWAWLGVRQPP